MGLAVVVGAVTGKVPRIAPGTLPAAEEAALNRTIGLVERGQVPTDPVMAKRWGATYENRNNELPGGQYQNSPFQEYRVMVAGANKAGPLRLVINNDTGAMYYTWTHYGDAGAPAFVQIR
jgi:guanyl-specific ribonuclease Sa